MILHAPKPAAAGCCRNIVKDEKSKPAQLEQVPAHWLLVVLCPKILVGINTADTVVNWCILQCLAQGIEITWSVWLSTELVNRSLRLLPWRAPRGSPGCQTLSVTEFKSAPASLNEERLHCFASPVFWRAGWCPGFREAGTGGVEFPSPAWSKQPSLPCWGCPCPWDICSQPGAHTKV